jgi:16S rRNA processing protein RimM
MTTAKTSPLVVLGTIGRPHGVRGELRVKSETADPVDIGHYGPLFLPGGRVLKVMSVRPGGEVVIMRFEGVSDRNMAAGLTNMTLAVPRSVLPETDEEEFYHTDLVGLTCFTTDDVVVGVVIAVHNFGAGELLDIKPPSGPNITLGFTKASVPVVDITGGRLIVVLPDVVEVKGG